MPKVVGSNPVTTSLKSRSKTILCVGAGWSSLVARRAHNPKVVGSNPAPATNFYSRYILTNSISRILSNARFAFKLM